MDNFNVLLEALGLKTLSFLRVTLPIGISFFVFHELSYVIDVYRKVKPPMKNIINYALYIFLFPQLIAGPIIRFNEIADQIQNRKYQDNIDNRLLGMFRFVIGLAKKVLIANVLGKEADRIFSLPNEQLDFVLSWVGALTYTFQIYFDFSGYSDMAIGLGRMMGFIFPENFNNPYISQSITDFWRRWHMSLSRWMKDYLYIPLGGNQVSDRRLYINLWVVFLISGFWHGAEWTFIIWGAYHGLFLAMERFFLLRITSGISKFFRVISTFFIVIIGWVFFRASNLDQAVSFLKKMFTFSYKEYFFSSHLIVVFLIALLFSFLPLFNGPSILVFPWFRGWKKAMVSAIITAIFFVLCIGEITSSTFNPFIYFKF
jgi:alginate O-acetyltransferase complex protein AlgI